MEDKSKSQDFMMEYKLNDHLDSQDYNALTLHAKALKPGAGEVKLLVIDQKTLLSTQKTVKINVLEN